MLIIAPVDERNLNLNCLRVLRAIGRERNVTRAAKRLGLSQPAVSGALARARLELDDPLFVRASGGMQATPRAEQLLQSIEAAFGLLQTALRQQSDFDVTTSNMTFDLLMSDIGQILCLSTLIEHLKRVAPGVRLRIKQLSDSSYGQGFGSTTADLGFGLDWPVPQGPAPSAVVFERLRVHVPRRPSADPGTLDGRALSRSLACEVGAGTRDDHQDARRDTARHKIELTVPHFMAIPWVVSNSDLVVTIARCLAETYSRTSNVRFLPLPFSLPPMNIGLYWPERCHRDPAHRWLRSIFVELFSDRAAPSAGASEAAAGRARRSRAGASAGGGTVSRPRASASGPR